MEGTRWQVSFTCSVLTVQSSALSDMTVNSRPVLCLALKQVVGLIVLLRLAVAIVGRTKKKKNSRFVILGLSFGTTNGAYESHRPGWLVYFGRF